MLHDPLIKNFGHSSCVFASKSCTGRLQPWRIVLPSLGWTWDDIVAPKLKSFRETRSWRFSLKRVTWSGPALRKARLLLPAFGHRRAVLEVVCEDLNWMLFVHGEVERRVGFAALPGPGTVKRSNKKGQVGKGCSKGGSCILELCAQAHGRQEVGRFANRATKLLCLCSLLWETHHTLQLILPGDDPKVLEEQNSAGPPLGPPPNPPDRIMLQTTPGQDAYSIKSRVYSYRHTDIDIDLDIDVDIGISIDADLDIDI